MPCATRNLPKIRIKDISTSREPVPLCQCHWTVGRHHLGYYIHDCIIGRGYLLRTIQSQKLIPRGLNCFRISNAGY